jgi:hypothetical protein
MKKIIAFLSTPISLLTHTESFWSLFNLITETKDKTKMEEHTSGYWIFQSISFIATIIFVTWVIMKFQKMFNKMEAIHLINEDRMYQNFILNSPEQLKLPNESNKDFFLRSNNANYLRTLVEEKERLTIQLAERLNITLKDAQMIMDDIYYEKIRNKKK